MPENKSQREEALALAHELLTDIELGNLGAVNTARKTSRLARLLDDGEAIEWLRYELSTYPSPLDAQSAEAARRSNRQTDEGKFWTASLAQLEAQAMGAEQQMTGLSAVGSGDWNLGLEAKRQTERSALRSVFEQRRALVERIIGAFHLYVADRYQELRFGSAVETAFEVVRRDVDARIGEVVPSALPMLAAAFENATSDNPEHWANAAATCRRLIKEVADVLRPPSGDVEVGGRVIKMGDGNYINRLVDWITHQGNSDTRRSLIQAELEFLGRRLDAADGAGQKGAHDHVGKAEASRYITATYLLIGDVLDLREEATETSDGQA